MNIEANDAFHAASAYQIGCNIFVTRDERLDRQINQLENMQWYKPEDLIQKLEENRKRR